MWICERRLFYRCNAASINDDLMRRGKSVAVAFGAKEIKDRKGQKTCFLKQRRTRRERCVSLIP